MGGSRPRPSPARGPTRPHGAPRRWRTVSRAPWTYRRSYALAHPGGEHAELVAVLRDRAAGDLDPALLEDVHDRLVGEWMLRVLLRHQLLDLRLDAAGGDVLP